MGIALSTRLLLTWFALAAITLFAWWLSTRHAADPLRPDTVIALGAIAIALVKVRVIMREYMQVRMAPARLRHVTDAWLVLFAVAMLIAYFHS